MSGSVVNKSGGVSLLDPHPPSSVSRRGNPDAVLDALLDDPETLAKIEAKLEAREAIEGRATSVYRFFNQAGELLYVGVTQRGSARFDEHAITKPWWNEVASATIEHHKSRPAAHRAEAKAIDEESPRYNIVRPAVPIAPLPPAEYRFVRGVRHEGKGILTREDAWSTLERQSRRYFKASAADVVRAFEAGEIARDDERLPSVVTMLAVVELPVAEFGS